MAWHVYTILGRRISATSGGVTRVSLYLGNDVVYEADGTAATKYVVAGGEYLAKVVSQARAGASGVLGEAVVTPPVEPPDDSTSTSAPTKTLPGYIPLPDDPIMIMEPPIMYPPPPDESPPGEEPPSEEPPPPKPQPLSRMFYPRTDLVGSIRAVTSCRGWREMTLVQAGFPVEGSVPPGTLRKGVAGFVILARRRQDTYRRCGTGGDGINLRQLGVRR